MLAQHREGEIKSKYVWYIHKHQSRTPTGIDLIHHASHGRSIKWHVKSMHVWGSHECASTLMTHHGGTHSMRTFPPGNSCEFVTWSVISTTTPRVLCLNDVSKIPQTNLVQAGHNGSPGLRSLTASCNINKTLWGFIQPSQKHTRLNYMWNFFIQHLTSIIRINIKL